MSPELVKDQFQWLRDFERDLYKTAISTLAERKKLRPVFVTKKPVAEQFAWIGKQLQHKQTLMIGEHLLQSWFMMGQQEMLIAFCDAMESDHDGKGVVEGELPEELDEEKLAKAVDVLFEKFPANLASLYLYVFNMQTNNGWSNLSKVLAEDSRITLD